MEDNITLQLKDIKPLMQIPDSTYYYYWTLVVLAVLIVLFLVTFFSIKFWKKRKINLAKGYLEALKNIVWEDSKKAAYEATHYARLLALHDPTLQQGFDELEPMLEQFKYRKNVDKVDDLTKEKFNNYVQVADGRI